MDGISRFFIYFYHENQLPQLIIYSSNEFINLLFIKWDYKFRFRHVILFLILRNSLKRLQNLIISKSRRLKYSNIFRHYLKSILLYIFPMLSIPVEQEINKHLRSKDNITFVDNTKSFNKLDFSTYKTPKDSNIILV